MRSRRQRLVCVATIARLTELLRSGLSTAEAVAVGAACGGAPGARLRTVQLRVERGQSLAAALQHACAGLHSHELAMLRAGEASGALERSFECLHRHLEQRGSARKQIVQAFAYPAFLVASAWGVLLVMSVFVLPSLTSLYEAVGQKLPVTTAALLALGAFVRAHGETASAIAVGGLGLLAAASRFPRARRLMDSAALAVPVLGPLRRARTRADVYGLLADLLESGCSLSRALSLCLPVIGNRALRQRWQRVERKVERGLPLGAAVAAGRIDRHGADAGILRTAEAGRGYPDALRRLSRVAEVQAEDRLRILARVAEPAAVAFMAAVVGIAALGLYQPVLESSALLASP